MLSAQERQPLQQIDQEFFSRKVQTGTGEADTLDQALVLPGLQTRRVIQMVRRVITPVSAVKDALALLRDLDHALPVVALEELSSRQVEVGFANLANMTTEQKAAKDDGIASTSPPQSATHYPR